MSPAPPPPAVPTREYRARLTFALAAIFGVVVLLLGLTFAGSFLASAPLALLLGLASIAIYAAAAVGLGNNEPGARSAMAALLWILIIEGLVQVVVALTRSSIHVPIGAILAAWALNARPDRRLGPVPALTTGGTVLVVGAVVAGISAINL